MWISNRSTRLQAIWGIGLLGVSRVLKLGLWLNFRILPFFVGPVMNITRRSSERPAVGTKGEKQRADK
jgi:hypothetical protein